MLDQSTLVLEGITLAQMIEFVVEVLVDLAGSAVLDQKATENAEAAHPHDLAVFKYHRSAFCSLCSSQYPVYLALQVND